MCADRTGKINLSSFFFSEGERNKMEWKGEIGKVGKFGKENLTSGTE